MNNYVSALTAIFDSADPLNEGKISMKEYLQVCQKNGIEVDDMLQLVKNTEYGWWCKIFSFHEGMYPH